MNHTEIIQNIIDKTNGKVYLEIGIASGINFLKIKAKKKIGVDPIKKVILKNKLKYLHFFFNSKIYKMTSDEYFLKFKNKINVAFIDGMHTYSQSLKDVENCLDNLDDSGVIIMHDCNPPSEKIASPKLIKGNWSGEVWKTIVNLRTRNDLNVFVIDCDWGVGIITRGTQENILTYSETEIEKMTYSDLEKNRKDFLNLKAYNQ